MKIFMTRVEQVVQRRCRCPVPGSVQGQVGWGFEQTNLVKDVPACGRRLISKGPSNPNCAVILTATAAACQWERNWGCWTFCRIVLGIETRPAKQSWSGMFWSLSAGHLDAMHCKNILDVEVLAAGSWWKEEDTWGDLRAARKQGAGDKTAIFKSLSSLEFHSLLGLA